MNNPFDMISAVLDGEMIYLRPVQFDSSDYNKEFIKPDGSMIRPTMAVGTCPKCSSVIEHQIAEDVQLNGSLMTVVCKKCNPPPKIIPFPFENPFDYGRLSVLHINPVGGATIKNAGKSADEPAENVSETEPTENKPILEQMFKRSTGLGSFLRDKHRWNGGPHNNRNMSRDQFDIFGNIGDNHEPEFNMDTE